MSAQLSMCAVGHHSALTLMITDHWVSPLHISDLHHGLQLEVTVFAWQVMLVYRLICLKIVDFWKLLYHSLVSIMIKMLDVLP